MIVTLYSTGCPRCTILKKKMDSKGIKYETISDVDLMQEKGFTELPMLEINGSIMNFKDAISWINGLEVIDEN